MSKDLTEALRALMEQQGGEAPKPMPERGAAAPSKAAGLLGGTPGKSGGIASPLTETAYADRTFHPDRLITSSDGILSIRVKPVKTMRFKDAGDNDVELIFKAPT